MGVLENIGVFRDKIATNKFFVVEASLSLGERILDEILRRFQKIMKEGKYDELKFNSYDLSETAKELQDYTIKLQRKLTADNLLKKKLSINETVDLWNQQTDFIGRALLISQKLSLLGFLIKFIEENSTEETLDTVLLETLRSFLAE